METRINKLELKLLELEACIKEKDKAIEQLYHQVQELINGGMVVSQQSQFAGTKKWKVINAKEGNK